MNNFSLIVLTSLMLTALLSCSAQKESMYKKSMPLMDTIVSITVVCDSKDQAEKAMEQAFAAIDRIGNLLNFYSDTSELSAINRNAGISSTKVSSDTFGIIEEAIYVADTSGGSFDPTIGPIMRLWDFADKKMPSLTEVRHALPLVNYQDIIMDRKTLTILLRKKGMMLDLGGIAKGYAADIAVASLIKNGILSGLVAIAGDIRTFGLKPDKSPWTIGIKNPRQTSNGDEIIAKVSLTEKAISTSGDYERYFIAEEKRYHHLLDPKTGFPAVTCRSVSIVTDKAVYTDAFSTAIFVLGPEKGMKLAKDLGMDALIIDSNGTAHSTDGLKGKLSFEKSSS
jgi:thiamine biosynthesis lipoprotein